MTFAIFGRLAFGICDSGIAGIWHLGIGAESNPAWHLTFAFSKALAFGICDFATAGIWNLPAAIVEIIGGVVRCGVCAKWIYTGNGDSDSDMECH